MKIIVLIGILLFHPCFAGTAIICHPDGTCDIVITQD